jgi:hypothetical protein
LICPDTGGYSYKTQTNRVGAKRRFMGSHKKHEALLRNASCFLWV